MMRRAVDCTTSGSDRKHLRQLLYTAAATFIGVSLGLLVTLAWGRIDRTLTTLERAASATEKAATELEETSRAARKAFISEK